jgi:hypothetical protein
MIEPRSRPLEPPAPVIEAAEVAVLYRPGRWYTFGEAHRAEHGTISG